MLKYLTPTQYHSSAYTNLYCTENDDIQNGVSQNKITEEITEEPAVGNEGGGEPPAEPAVENESGEEPSVELITDTEETSIKSIVDKVKPTAELTLDNGSERKLPEKITTVNIDKPTEKVTTINAGKPHVKFIVDEGNFPMKPSVDWGSKMSPLDEYPVSTIIITYALSIIMIHIIMVIILHVIMPMILAIQW